VILAKQQELHLKCELSKKYITITKDYVTMIQTAASSVSSSALENTVNSAVSVTDSYTAAGTAGMIASAHTKLKEQLKKETTAERERCRLQGVDNPSECHADEAGTTAWNHNSHVDVANHADTNNMGQNQQYDANGEPVDDDDEQAPQEAVATSRRLLSAQTLGSVITDILTQVTAEENRVATTCDLQEAAFTSQHVDTVRVAQTQYDAQTQEDEDRLNAAQAAQTQSFEALQSALTRKKTAQSTYDAKATTLRDAIATQTQYVPVVNQAKTDSLKANTDNQAAAQQRIEGSKTKADAKYDEQDALLTDVKAKIAAGLNKSELLQTLTTVVKKVVKTRLYSFTAGSANNFADKASGKYHASGQGGTNSQTYSTDSSTTLTALIEKLIADNTAQLEVVKKASDADLEKAVKTRDDRITAADSTLQDELNRLQGAVDSAKEALDQAKDAEEAQKTIKDAAVADRVAKEATHAQTVEKGNQKKEAANNARTSCQENALSLYKTETAAYDQSLENAKALLAYERGVVAQIRAAMNGDAFAAAPEMKGLNHCTDEKAASVTAATKCNDDKNACEKSKVDALDNGSTQTATSRRLLSADSCADETTSCAAKDTTRTAYTSCIGASLLSTEELKAAFVQLHSKYASETDMDSDNLFSAHKTKMEQVLVAVEGKITQEETAAESQQNADAASSLLKKNTEDAACIATEQAVIDEWNGKVATAKSNFDAAKIVETTEVGKYDALVAITKTKQEEYNEATSKQQTEGATAGTLHEQDVDGAWEVYTTTHGTITSIATADYAYLNEENESLTTIKDIVVQLNLDENLNGAHTASTYTTSTHATAAAETNAHSAGQDINGKEITEEGDDDETETETEDENDQDQGPPQEAVAN